MLKLPVSSISAGQRASNAVGIIGSDFFCFRGLKSPPRQQFLDVPFQLGQAEAHLQLAGKVAAKLGAHNHARVLTIERPLVVAGVLHGLVGGFQQHELQRVGLGHLLGRNLVSLPVVSEISDETSHELARVGYDIAAKFERQLLFRPLQRQRHFRIAGRVEQLPELGRGSTHRGARNPGQSRQSHHRRAKRPASPRRRARRSARLDSVNSSSTQCMFNPPMPKALTPALRGEPSACFGQGTAEVGTYTGALAQSMLGFSSRILMAGGIVSCCIARQVLMTPAMPAISKRVADIGFDAGDGNPLAGRKLLSRESR